MHVATEEMEVDPTQQYCEPLQGNGTHTSLLVSLLSGMGPLPGEEPMVSTPIHWEALHFYQIDPLPSFQPLT